MSDLTLFRMTGGGHTWPGALADSGPGGTTTTISATDVMWAFFRPIRCAETPTGSGRAEVGGQPVLRA
jgi:poly(3-hydroxybutyrate) depolymerase